MPERHKVPGVPSSPLTDVTSRRSSPRHGFSRAIGTNLRQPGTPFWQSKLSIFRIWRRHIPPGNCPILRLAVDQRGVRSRRPRDAREQPKCGTEQSRRILMQVEPLVILLLIGAIAGFLAGIIVKGYGFGVVGNIVVGIVGAVVGGWLLPQLGLFPGVNFPGQIISATAGAVVLLLLISFVRRRVA